jgi:hypothetical protein
MSKSYKIFPSIGVARVGNSESEYYIAADTPQQNFVPAGGYRDPQRKIKRMGQTFRIYEFEDGTPVREITAAEARIVWEVHVANSKAAKPELNPGIPRERLIASSGNQFITGSGQHVALKGTISPLNQPIEIKLGDLHTTDAGRLVVLGGHGKAASWNGTPPGGIQNSGWYDDTSDGPVRATLQLHDSPEAVTAESAWVIAGVADFAHAVPAIVTLYDLARDRSVPPFQIQPSAPVLFTQEIFPVLHRAVFMQWVSSSAKFGHASASRGDFLSPAQFPLMHDRNAPGGRDARTRVFNRLRNPQGGGGNMPPLSGNLTVTAMQYSAFSRWAQGDFLDDWNSAWDPYNPPQPKLDELPIHARPDALNQAALGSGVGGSFFPGIEAGSRMADSATYEQPFRISHLVAAGGLTQSLGVPWQADFKFCVESWWPSARPGVVDVPTGGSVEPRAWDRGVQDSAQMVRWWSELGFVVKDPGSSQLRYIETERTLPGIVTLDAVLEHLKAVALEAR